MKKIKIELANISISPKTLSKYLLFSTLTRKQLKTKYQLLNYIISY